MRMSLYSFQQLNFLHVVSYDFDKLVVTVLRTLFKKTTPKDLHHRDYNIFSGDDFKTELKQNLATSSSNYKNI